MGTVLEKPATRTDLWFEAVYEDGVFRPLADPGLTPGSHVLLGYALPPTTEPDAAEADSPDGDWRSEVDWEKMKRDIRRWRDETPMKLPVRFSDDPHA